MPEKRLLTSHPGDHFDLFSFQQQVFPILLGWAVGSVVAGLAWLSNPSQWWRGLGLQFLTWGAIDGIIALFGLRGVRLGRVQYLQGELNDSAVRRRARQFEWIVWANVLLDFGYVLIGRRMARSTPQDARRQGMGWGIILQGLFLLVWDVCLGAWTHARRTR